MMASRKKSNESSRPVTNNTRRHAREAMFSSSSSSEETEDTTGSHNCQKMRQEHFKSILKACAEKGQQRDQDVRRREEYPFSFKHFLKNDTQTNYYKTGARPKVYPSPATSPNNLENHAGASYSRNPTELPDFVQDHLVIEQCYFNREPSQEEVPDIDNLPDFALNSAEQRQRQSRHRNESQGQSETLPFDLTSTLDKATDDDASGLDRLDLPAFDRLTERAEPAEFPYDLPLPLSESDSNIATRDCSQISETAVPKSLPDFLSDGPMHNKATVSPNIESATISAESLERLCVENERLRQALFNAQSQVNERTKRIRLLETELLSKRVVEHEETTHLERAMEQVEDNLKRSTRRAISAENTVTSLKKEIKILTTEISLLRLENDELRSGRGTTTGHSEVGASSSNVDQTIRRLAYDLRSAASTAEVSLRQLMSGVDNLRMLASALENVNRIEDRTKDFLPDFDDDNAAGPAL